MISLNTVILQAPLRTNIHGGLQRNTKQGLRYIASSPEHFQRTLDVGSGRLQRTLDWLEFHTSSTVFTAFDYVRDADERVHEASLVHMFVLHTVGISAKCNKVCVRERQLLW